MPKMPAIPEMPPMIVPWFNNKDVTVLITCDLHRIGKSKFCRIHNKHNLAFPTLYWFLELMTIVCYKNYFLYLIIGATWGILQTPFVLYKTARKGNWNDFKQDVKNIPVHAGTEAYLKGKNKLELNYVSLQRKYKMEKTKADQAAQSKVTAIKRHPARKFRG